MLLKVSAFSPLPNIAALEVPDVGRIETDPFQIRQITGLDPGKASLYHLRHNAKLDGGAYVGGSLPPRNIVLSIHPNPDWVNNDMDSLRKMLYLYFTPKQQTQLVFHQDNPAKGPLTIFGHVESCEANPFVQDVEFTVSIICPDPYFASVDPIVVTGRTTQDYLATVITYDGDTPTGFQLEVDAHSGEPAPTWIKYQLGNPGTETFMVNATVDTHQYFLMSSVQKNKYVDTVRTANGLVVSQLSQVADGATWPLLSPGDNAFGVMTDAGAHDFTVRYYERYAGL